MSIVLWVFAVIGMWCVAAFGVAGLVLAFREITHAASRLAAGRHPAPDWAFLTLCKWCADEGYALPADCTCTEACDHVSYCMRRMEVTP